MTMFKQGDRVRLTGTSNLAVGEIGDVGTIQFDREALFPNLDDPRTWVARCVHLDRYDAEQWVYEDELEALPA